MLLSGLHRFKRPLSSVTYTSAPPWTSEKMFLTITTERYRGFSQISLVGMFKFHFEIEASFNILTIEKQWLLRCWYQSSVKSELLNNALSPKWYFAFIWDPPHIYIFFILSTEFIYDFPPYHPGNKELGYLGVSLGYFVWCLCDTRLVTSPP